MGEAEDATSAAITPLVRTLLATVADPTLVLDEEGRILAASEAAGAVFGYRSDELAALEVDRLLPTLVLSNTQPIELLGRRKDGSEVPLHAGWTRVEGTIVLTLRRSQPGAFDGPVRTAVDECFRRLVDRMREVLWVANSPCTRILYVSPAYETIWGLSCQSLRENPISWFEAVHPDDQPRVAAAFLHQPRELVNQVYRVVRPDGSIRWVRDRGITIEGVEPESLIAGIAEDITEVKESQDAKRHTDDLLRSFAATVRDVFFMVEPEGKRVIYVSPAYETVWGRTCASLYEAPTSWFDGVHPDDREHVRRASSLGTPQRGDAEFTYRIVRPDGSLRWIRDRSFSVTDDSGALRFIAGVAADITELKVAEESLRRSEARLRHAEKLDAIGRLAGGVAHDFNNHLAAITAYADLALARSTVAAVASDVTEIKKSAERAAELTHKLLALSRQRPVTARVVDVNEIVREMQHTLARLVGEDIEIETVLDPAVGCVMADPGQLEQVLLNLAVNARDAMPQGGRLFVTTVFAGPEAVGGVSGSPPTGWAVIRVRDTGAGIAPEVRSRLFEPFVTTKAEGRGTGLGLSIVYGIVTQAGGQVAVDSEPGLGTTITLHLPRTTATTNPIRGAVAVAAPRGTENILVVEDNRPLREAIVQALTQSGYRVAAAENGPHAVEIVDKLEHDLDVLITDVVMPRMRGDELAQRLTERWPRLRVLFMSGFASGMTETWMPVEGSFLQKPFSLAALSNVVRTLIDSVP
jgi:PAS domain S-box-containing protein